MDATQRAMASGRSAISAAEWSALAGPVERHWPGPRGWHADFAVADWHGALAALGVQPERALALDLRAPFCALPCLYCHRATRPTPDDGQVEAYVESLLAEAARAASLIGRRAEVAQLYLGGGTPNDLGTGALVRLMDGLRTHFRLLPQAACSIRLDARRSGELQLSRLRELGFERVRFGLADLDPSVQRDAGRLQSAALLQDAVGLARRAGLAVDVDWLCGLPAQTPASVRATARALLRLGADRLQCRPLRRLPGLCTLQDEDLPTAADTTGLRREVDAVWRSAGRVAVGGGLYVRDGDALALPGGRASANTLGPGAQPPGDVLGLGPGAVSEVGGTLACHEPAPGRWQMLVGEGACTVVGGRRGDVATGRLRAGLRQLAWLGRWPSGLPTEAFASSCEPFASAVARRWLAEHADGWFLTPEGRLHADELLVQVAAAFEALAPPERAAAAGSGAAAMPLALIPERAARRVVQ